MKNQEELVTGDAAIVGHPNSSNGHATNRSSEDDPTAQSNENTVDAPHPAMSNPEFSLGRYSFKKADTEAEFDSIHRLNYQTFVQEIQQYADTGQDQLVDKFHDKNMYFIAKRDGEVVGMVAVHDEPPFSVASRMEDPSLLMKPGNRPLEIRLLAVQPGERNSLVFAGVVWTLYNYALEYGYSHLVISGVIDKVRLYKRLGFVEMGPPIPQGETSFVPMMCDPRQLPDEVRAREPMWMGKMKRDSDDRAPMAVLDENARIKKLRDLAAAKPSLDATIPAPHTSFLPGPVQIASNIRSAFAQPPISHRDLPFIEQFDRVRSILSNMVSNLHVAIMPGSGTLSNEIVAANLAAINSIGRGVILVNGEFGHRLADIARRHGLEFQTIEWPWGKPWDCDQICDVIGNDESINWLWAVHLESSVGRVNDIQEMRRCVESVGRPVHLCLDCVSSIGAVPIDATGIHLISGASGKALGSYAGVSIVCAPDELIKQIDSARVPSYLDLPASFATDGPRYTFPSPMLMALDTALENYATPELCEETFSRYKTLGGYIRKELRRVGMQPLVEDAQASPVITTFSTPFDMQCEEFLDICRSWGFELSGLSGYLARRNWAQIATMGELSKGDCAPFFTQLEAWLIDHKRECSK